MQIARHHIAIALGILGMLCLSMAQGQSERSGGGVNAQLAQQYQQAVAERTQLQSDNAKLKKDLDDTKKELDAAKRQLAALNANTGKAQAELTAAQTSSQNNEKTLEQTKAKLQELVDRFRDNVATLRGTETERVQLQQQLVQAKAAIDQCAQRNVALSELNAEVLDRYQHQGVFDHLAKAEPFTRIERAKIDNLVLEDRQRVDELRVQKQSTAVQGTMSGTAPPVAPASGAPAPSGKN